MVPADACSFCHFVIDIKKYGVIDIKKYGKDVIFPFAKWMGDDEASLPPDQKVEKLTMKSPSRPPPPSLTLTPRLHVSWVSTPQA